MIIVTVNLKTNAEQRPIVGVKLKSSISNIFFMDLDGI